MGVHITFVRSVQLDSWNIDQLRAMKLGGNDKALEALKGVEFRDAKTKYTSRQLTTYKERLNRLIAEDVKKYPRELVLEGYEDSNTNAAPTTTTASKDPSQTDFFADWGMDSAIKNQISPTTSNGQSTSASGPLRFSAPSQDSSALLGNKADYGRFSGASERPSSVSQQAAQISSNHQSNGWNNTNNAGQGGWNANQQSNDSNNWGAPQQQQTHSGNGWNKPVVAEQEKPAERVSVTMAPVQILPSSSNVSTTGGFKKKGGAKKVTKVIDFEEAARQAELEAERVQQQEQIKATAAKASTAKSPSNPYSSQPSPSSFQSKTSTYGSKPAPSAEPPVVEFKKFGFGFDPTAAGAASSTPATAAAKPPASSSQNTSFKAGNGFGGGFGSFPNQSTTTPNSETAAKFGNAKSISSDQYFGRGQYDEAANAEARAKLAQFEGKSGFGSADYHGYSEEDSMAARRPSVENAITVVQDSAQEFAQKFAGQAQEDFESLKKLVTVGGSKLGDLLSDLQNRYGG